jgi:hypothetical protein
MSTFSKSHYAYGKGDSLWKIAFVYWKKVGRHAGSGISCVPTICTKWQHMGTRFMPDPELRYVKVFAQRVLLIYTLITNCSNVI